MILHWPQIAMMVFYASSIALEIAAHDEPINRLLGVLFRIVGIGVLYFGGFWTGAAQ